jgi:transposase-like protein
MLYSGVNRMVHGGIMATPIRIVLDRDQKMILEEWTRKGKTQKRYADRAWIILRSSEGESRDSIAGSMGITPATVSKWRKQFVEKGIDRLSDRIPAGKPPKYDEKVRTRILEVLPTLTR